MILFQFFFQVVSLKNGDVSASPFLNAYVMMPNANPVKETVNTMPATRFYEANITEFNAMKTMAQKTLKKAVGKTNIEGQIELYKDDSYTFVTFRDNVFFAGDSFIIYPG